MDCKNPVATAVYIRVSTEEQAREGFSINAQKEKLRQYAFARDWDIFDFYIDDGVSGKNIKDRPEINRMLRDVKSGKANNVLVYKIDRLTRSTKNLIELMELFNEEGCSFNSLMESIDTSSATGRMFIKIVGIFAEFERENLAERVSFGYEQKTREGNYTNTNGVYGYDYVKGSGDLVVNEEERRVVTYIYSQYLNGESMTAICRDLTEKQVPTKRGGKWSQSTIQSILTNPLYIGKVRYGVAGKRDGGFKAEGRQDSILDDETFYTAQKIIESRKKYHVRSYPSENAVFLGSLFCGKCGSKMGASQHKRKETLYVNYYCHNAKTGGCDCRSLSQNRIERAFIGYLSCIEPFDASAPEIYHTPANGSEKQKNAIWREIAKTEKRIKDVRALFLRDELSLDEYREFERDLELKIQQLSGGLQDITGSQEEFCDCESAKYIVGDVRENWVRLSQKEKSEFTHKFISRIDICTDKDVYIGNCEFYNNA